MKVQSLTSPSIVLLNHGIRRQKEMPNTLKLPKKLETRQELKERRKEHTMKLKLKSTTKSTKLLIRP